MGKKAAPRKAPPNKPRGVVRQRIASGFGPYGGPPPPQPPGPPPSIGGLVAKPWVPCGATGSDTEKVCNLPVGHEGCHRSRALVHAWRDAPKREDS